MAMHWNMGADDRVLVERAIGGAIMDKLRGRDTTLAAVYKAEGGTDETSVKTLNSFEAGFRGLNLSKVSQALSPGRNFNETFKNWDMSSHELSLVERAIGAAILNKLEGTGGQMHEHYTRLGGLTAEAQAALKTASTMLDKAEPARLAS